MSSAADRRAAWRERTQCPLRSGDVDRSGYAGSLRSTARAHLAGAGRRRVLEVTAGAPCVLTVRTTRTERAPQPCAFVGDAECDRSLRSEVTARADAPPRDSSGRRRSV
jgi:hypothetical protein